MSVTYSAEPFIRWSLAPSHFILQNSFTVTWNRPGKELVKFKVQEGFSTDFASIPRAFRSIIPQVGKHIQPAIAHDWAYEDNTDLTRAEADRLFLEGMEAVGVWWLRRRLMYLAVRAFGGALWG